jgi:prevent-host-death family protein
MPRPVRRASAARSTPSPPGRSARIPAGRFKATCLAVMDAVHRTGEPVTVTKHGTPVVRVVPAAARGAAPLFGRLKGGVRIMGDLLAPLDVEWAVLADD